MIIKIQTNSVISFLNIPTTNYSLMTIFNYSDLFLKSVLYEKELEQKFHFLEDSIDEILKFLNILSHSETPAKTFLSNIHTFKFPTTKLILNDVFEQSYFFKEPKWAKTIELFDQTKTFLKNNSLQNTKKTKINIVLLFLLFQNPLIKIENIEKFIKNPQNFFIDSKTNDYDVFLNFDERKITLNPKTPSNSKTKTISLNNSISLENTMFFEEFLAWNQRIISEKLSHIWIKKNAIATLYKIN